MCVLLYAVSLVLDLFIYLLNLVEPVCYGEFSIFLIFSLLLAGQVLDISLSD